jgi:hypothetical protein
LANCYFGHYGRGTHKNQYNHIYFQNAIQSSSVLFIFGTDVFLYSRSLIVENPKITFRDIYHFIPFLLFTLVLLINKKEGPLTTGSWFIQAHFLLSAFFLQQPLSFH